ncbi:MAG: histidinol dehydrogenase [Oscillospiraceae bacterium]|nr:histidinol dehydrogenase [Oscillospiraceae bacterium]
MIRIIDLRDNTSPDLIQSIVSSIRSSTTALSSDVTASVMQILTDVKNRGDKALAEYTERFDGYKPESFELSKEEINAALGRVDEDILDIMREAVENIERFHTQQLKKGYTIEKDGVVMGQRITPIENVGIYIPGGTASYPSTLLMNVIPAKIAGVKNICIATPPDSSGNISDYILAAAAIASVHRVFRIGGAQAIAAFSYGTKSVPKMDLIAGPGNIYVATAKRLVFGEVGIDMIAGPSDVLIIADDYANPTFIAADLLAQAEHDENSGSILIAFSEDIAQAVSKQIEMQLANLERSSIAGESIAANGRIYIVKDMEQAIRLANEIAPEHLELLVENPFEILDSIVNAGSVFLGPYTPEAVGDYFAGPNHTLPTLGTARFASSLTVDSFVKKSSFLSYSREALQRDANSVERFAMLEGLSAHANSVKVRREALCLDS